MITKNDIENLLPDTKIDICGNQKSIKSAVQYSTYEEPFNIYYKLITDDHEILVISIIDAFCYIGKIIPQVTDGLPLDEIIIVNGEIYEKINQGYQIVNEIIFGNANEIEGEVFFIDFVSKPKSKIISIAEVSRSKERADVLANLININDININRRGFLE